MGNKDKTWVCGDCDAVHTERVSTCNAPDHDLKVEIWRKGLRIAELEGTIANLKIEAKNSKWNTTLDEFIEQYTWALRDYMSNSYDDTRTHHPEDLSAAMATFTDAWYAIHSNSWRTEK